MALSLSFPPSKSEGIKNLYYVLDRAAPELQQTEQIESFLFVK